MIYDNDSNRNRRNATTSNGPVIGAQITDNGAPLTVTIGAATTYLLHRRHRGLDEFGKLLFRRHGPGQRRSEHRQRQRVGRMPARPDQHHRDQRLRLFEVNNALTLSANRNILVDSGATISFQTRAAR